MSIKTNDWLAAIACIAAGVLIATLPHFIAWTRIGRPYYVASPDDRFYLAIASQAFFNHPFTIADPIFVGKQPTVFRPTQFLPGVWAAKFLGLDPLGIGLMCRVFAGSTIGLGWYLLFRQWLRGPWVAAPLSLMLLGDTGLTHGTPLLRLGLDTMIILLRTNEAYFHAGHWIHLEWRSVNPAMTMVYLLGLIWAVTRALKSPSRGRIALSGVSFGLLFYVYFYYWTAAGLALLIAMILDAGNRRLYFHVGWIGGLIGLPAVVSDFLLKRDLPAVTDYLHRNDKFVIIGRFNELELSKDMMVIIILGLAWVLIRRRELIFVWALGAAGIILENNQLLTRLQFDNYHWEYVWGPAYSFYVAVAVADELGQRLNWRASVCACIGAVGLSAFGVGLWIRSVEATGSVAVAAAHTIMDYRSEFHSGRESLLAPNTVAAGDPGFVDFAAILDNLRPLAGWSAYNSCVVTDAELDEREALNELLRGVDRAAFESSQPREFVRYKMGPWYRDRSLIAGRVAARLAAYDRAQADLSFVLDRFGIRYVGLLTGTRPEYLATGWSLIATGPTWEVWERTTAQHH